MLWSACRTCSKIVFAHWTNSVFIFRVVVTSLVQSKTKHVSTKEVLILLYSVKIEKYLPLAYRFGIFSCPEQIHVNKMSGRLGHGIWSSIDKLTIDWKILIFCFCDSLIISQNERSLKTDWQFLSVTKRWIYNVNTRTFKGEAYNLSALVNISIYGKWECTPKLGRLI